jgi:hypothetical protein
MLAVQRKRGDDFVEESDDGDALAFKGQNPVAPFGEIPISEAAASCWGVSRVARRCAAKYAPVRVIIVPPF